MKKIIQILSYHHPDIMLTQFNASEKLSNTGHTGQS